MTLDSPARRLDRRVFALSVVNSCNQGDVMAITRRTASRAPASIGRLSLDEAFIGLLIGAMEANGHVSPEEAGRAHHMLWSMRRFRRKSGDVVGGMIAKMKELVSARGALAVVSAATRAVPKRLRESAFAVVADLVLVDGRIERAERRFLHDTAADFGLGRDRAAEIVDIMRIKNRA